MARWRDGNGGRSEQGEAGVNHHLIRSNNLTATLNKGHDKIYGSALVVLLPTSSTDYCYVYSPPPSFE